MSMLVLRGKEKQGCKFMSNTLMSPPQDVKFLVNYTTVRQYFLGTVHHLSPRVG